MNAQGVESGNVYLTFDDGPHATITPEILRQLRCRGVKATFFVVGERVSRPGALKIIAAAIADGHLIGNHTTNHRDLTACSPKELVREVTGVNAALRSLGIAPTLVRPPYGRTNPSVDAAIEQLGCQTALWDNDPRDWSKAAQPDKWVDAAVNGVINDRHNVIICHDTHATTAAHLPELLERLLAAGYEFATLPEQRAS